MFNLALITAVIFFILGMLGTIFPALPGSILVFAGMVIYGFMTGFSNLNVSFYILEFAVLVLTFLIDFLATAKGAKHFGGSRGAAIGAAAGTILGLITLGPLGIVIGPFVGAVLAELISGTEIKQSLRSGFGSVVGIVGGTIFKLSAEILMIVYFFIKI